MAAKKKHATPAKRSGGQTVWLVAAAAAVIVVAVVVLANLGGRTAGGAPPEEQKYLGRLLPPGYEEPKVAGPSAYTSTIKMTTVAAAERGGEVSIAANDVATKKMVYFEVKNAAGSSVPMIAYAKPSGKLFVGVSFCPPCQGKGQRIEPDMTLTCETCGTKRNLETQVGLSGACKLYPLDELPSKISGGKIVVEKSAIQGWSPQPKDRPIGG